MARAVRRLAAASWMGASDRARQYRENDGIPCRRAPRCPPCNVAGQRSFRLPGRSLRQRNGISKAFSYALSIRPAIGTKPIAPNHKSVDPDCAPIQWERKNQQRQTLLAPRHRGTETTMAQQLSASKRETPVCGSNASFCRFRDPDGHRVEVFTSHYPFIDREMAPMRRDFSKAGRSQLWRFPAQASWFLEASEFEGVPTQDSPMTLKLWQDEHCSKVWRMVRSLIVDGIPHHDNPTPDATIHRGLLITSAILSRYPAAGECQASNERQAASCFAHFSQILDAANADPQDVVRVKMFLRHFSDRPLINPHWLKMNPDPQHRPARHAIHSELSEDCIIQMAAAAVLPED